MPGIVDGPIPDEELFNLKKEKEQSYSIAKHSYHNFKQWLRDNIDKPNEMQLNSLFYILGIDQYLSSQYSITFYRSYGNECYTILLFNDQRFDYLFRIIEQVPDNGHHNASAIKSLEYQLREINKFIYKFHQRIKVDIENEFNDSIRDLFTNVKRKLD